MNKTNIDVGSPTQLHFLSIEELIAAVVFIKGYQRMEFEEEFMATEIRNLRKVLAV